MVKSEINAESRGQVTLHPAWRNAFITNGPTDQHSDASKSIAEGRWVVAIRCECGRKHRNSV